MASINVFVCFSYLLSLKFWCLFLSSSVDATDPNIIALFIDSDDSLSFTNSPKTPFLNELIEYGITLTSVDPTASRSSFLSGKVSQGTNDKFLASKLRSLGYNTFGVGRWPLNLVEPQNLPTHHGFQDYFEMLSEEDKTHEITRMFMQATRGGVDDEEFMVKIWNDVDHQATTSTEIYTARAIEKLQRAHVQPFFLYMSLRAWDAVSVDQSVAALVNHLKSSDQWANTVFLFLSDNGRSEIRASGFLGGGFVERSLLAAGTTPYRFSGIVRSSDFHVSLLGLSSASKDSMGIDLWELLMSGGKTGASRAELPTSTPSQSAGILLATDEFSEVCFTRAESHSSFPSRVQTLPSVPSIPRKLVSTSLDVLSLLYNSTNGDSWTIKTNWLSGTPCPSGSWYGISCSGSDVARLSLTGNNLVGSLPSQIGLITSITSHFYLNSNQISQLLPSEIGQLSKFETRFYISDNSFTGSLPSQLGQLTGISSFLVLFSNEFTGSIPSQLGQLTGMQSRFNVYSNSFSGSFPSQLGQLTKMTVFYQAYSNDFSGSFPSQLGLLTSMEGYFSFRSNNFNGSLPSQLGQLTTMTSNCYLFSNGFTGLLPSQLGQLSGLDSIFSIYSNHFSGKLPSEMGQLTKLTSDFVIYSNSFTGTLPSQLGSMTLITSSFQLFGNSFCGEIPSQIASLSSLVTTNWDLLSSGNYLGTPCCEVIPAAYTCTPTNTPTSLPTSVPTSTTLSPTPLPSITPTIQCASGSYLDGLSCEECAIGFYSTFEGAPFPTNCSLCPTGKYNTASGSSECIDCATGKLSSADRTFCRDCNAGEYSFNNECVECEYGKYAPRALTDSCLECAAGSHTNNGTGATTCTSCDAGTYSNASSVECTSCVRGKYSSSGASGCGSCEVGFIAPSVGSSSCTSCSAGRYTAFRGSFNCTACPIGQYQGSTGQSECVNCDEGKYTNRAHSTTCTICDMGYDSDAGSSSCDLAAFGYYLSWPNHESRGCPEHATCSGRNQVPVPDDSYWIDHSAFQYSSEIYRCSRDTCYRKSNANSNQTCWSLVEFTNSSESCDFDELQCIQGSQGPLCGACTNGYVYQGVSNSCEKCENAKENSYLAFGVVVFFALIVMVCLQFGDYLGLKRFPPVRFLLNVDTGCLKVLWVTYQIIVSSSFTLGIEFPSPFSEMLSVLSIFSLDFFALECFNHGANTYFLTAYLWCLMPILLGVIILLVGVMRLSFFRLLASSTDSKLTTKSISNQNVWLLLFLSYLVLPPVSNKQLQIFDCITLKSGESYLRSNTSIDCNSKSYLEFQAIILIFIAVYQMIPIVWFVTLYRHRDALNPNTSNNLDTGLAIYIRDNNPDLAPLRFLFLDYRCPKWWFEIADMYRRIIFIGIVPLISPRPATRASFGCMLAIMSVAYFREEQPYRVNFTNVIAHIAQFSILVTFYGALTIESDSMISFGLKGVSMGVFLFFLNLIILILSFWFAWICYQKQHKQELLKNSKATENEDARTFGATKFNTTFQAIWSHLVPCSHTLLFHYTSFQLALNGRQSGIPAQQKFDGVPLTLRQPHSTLDNDFDVFSGGVERKEKPKFPHEEVLVLSLPKEFLVPLPGYEYDEGLCMISAKVLNAMMPTSFTAVVASQPWLDGTVMLPPQCILRCFRLLDDAIEMSVRKLPRSSKTLPSEPLGLAVETNYLTRKEGAHHESSSVASQLVPLDSVDIFVNKMKRIRQKAFEQQLVPLYHYTSKTVARLILHNGLRMSSQGQGDGGVYVSTQGPASYGLGSDDYEINIIKDCFGVERIDEYQGQGKLDVIIVYACEPLVLQQAPGGRENAKMFTKSTFKGFSLEHSNGNFFLRPDRILGAFRVKSKPLLDHRALVELENEKQREHQVVEQIEKAQLNQISNIARIDIALKKTWVMLGKIELDANDAVSRNINSSFRDSRQSVDIEMQMGEHLNVDKGDDSPRPLLNRTKVTKKTKMSTSMTVKPTVRKSSAIKKKGSSMTKT